MLSPTLCSCSWVPGAMRNSLKAMLLPPELCPAAGWLGIRQAASFPGWGLLNSSIMRALAPDPAAAPQALADGTMDLYSQSPSAWRKVSWYQGCLPVARWTSLATLLHRTSLGGFLSSRSGMPPGLIRPVWTKQNKGYTAASSLVCPGATVPELVRVSLTPGRWEQEPPGDPGHEAILVADFH